MENDNDSLKIIAKSLAFLCLTAADLRDKGIASQAELLKALGLSRSDTAALLDTSEASISELLSRKRRKKGKARGQAKK